MVKRTGLAGLETAKTAIDKTQVDKASALTIGFEHLSGTDCASF